MDDIDALIAQAEKPQVAPATHGDEIDNLISQAEGGNVSRETPTKEPDYLQNVTQPMINAEAKLHARNDEFNKLPLAQKPARFVNDLAGGLGDVVTGLAGSAVNLIPQKAQAAIGDVIEKPVQALGSGLASAGKAVASVTPEPVKQLGSDVAGAVKGFAEQHPIVTEYAKAVPNAAMMVLPGGGIAKAGLKAGNAEADAIQSGLSSIPSSIETLGKTFKAGELKIPNAIAKKSYGADLIEKKKSIINDIAEFGVTHGNNEEAASDAMVKAGQRFDKADEIANDLATDPRTPKMTPTDVAMSGIDIKKISSTGDRKTAKNIIDNVLNDMKADGHDQPVTLDQLIQAKQNLNNDGRLFVNGPAESSSDQLAKAIKKKMYLNIVDAIGEISPEIKAMNTEGKRLLDVNAALSAAASRNANHDAAGLTDFILGGASIVHPGSLAATAPLFIAKKTLANGRAGNMVINLGRKLGGKEENTIEGTLNKLQAAEDAKTAPGTTAWDAKTELPENAATPTYFRQGMRPETQPLGAGYSLDRAARMGAMGGDNLDELAKIMKRLKEKQQ